MAVIRAQVSIPRDTALPEDVSMNTWHFDVFDGPNVIADLQPIRDALNTFYQGVGVYLSSVCNNPVTVNWYNLNDPAPRPPYRTDTLTLTFGTASGPMPEEVAVCVSFKGAAAAGAIAARRRGRVYLGPLAGGTTQIIAGRVLLGTVMQTQMRDMAAGLLTTSNASPTWRWVVYSPTTDAATAGGPSSAVTPVTQGWVDNAFDTQRRRGPTATARLLF